MTTIPKPPRLRLLENNPGKRPPKPRRTPRTAGVPEPPAGLDRIATAEWRRVTALLAIEGTVSKLDRGVLLAYVGAYSRLVSATAALGDGGPLTVAGSHGSTQPRPEIRIVNAASALVARLAGELGLSPAGRARLGVGTEPEKVTASWLPPELRDPAQPAAERHARNKKS